MSNVSNASSFASGAISDMQRGNSILRTFGKPGRTLKRRIATTGFICRFMFFLAFNPIFQIRAGIDPDAWSRRKAAAMRLARRFFPFTSEGYDVTPSEHGHIIAINHPTLNDPICAILYALYLNPDREVIVPVNLPWYESICSYRTNLLKVGVNIVPILTPQTAKRLGERSDILKFQTAFMKYYTDELIKTVSGGGIAVVAQQATRKHCLFKDPEQAETGHEILSTITLILNGINRAGLLDKVLFIPVGVIPYSRKAKSKLNVFKKYMLNIGEPISSTDLLAVKNAAKRPADLYILNRLKDLLPAEYHFENRS